MRPVIVVLAVAACGDGGSAVDGSPGSDGPARADAPSLAPDAPVLGDAPMSADARSDGAIADSAIADAPTPDAPVFDASVPDAPNPDAPPVTQLTFTIVNYVELPDTEAVVLVSDNGGPWQPVTGAGGVYHPPVVGPRYAIARACKSGPWSTIQDDVNIYYLTLDDGLDVRDLGCRRAGETASISGSVSWSGSGHEAFVDPGWQWGNTLFTPGPWSANAVPRTISVVGFLAPTSGPGQTDRMLIHRDVVISGATVHHVNFDTDGFDPVAQPLVITGTTDGYSTTVSLTGPLWGLDLERAGSIATYHAPPASRMRPGELLRVRAVTWNSAYDSIRWVEPKVSAPAPIGAAFPPAYTNAAPAVIAQTPDIRVGGTLPLVSGADYYTTSIELYSEIGCEWGDPIGTWTMHFSARWAQGQPIAFEYPRLVGIGGWTARLSPGFYDWRSIANTSAAGTPLPGVLNELDVPGEVLQRSAQHGGLDATGSCAKLRRGRPLVVAPRVRERVLAPR